jgi:hypothetical protein
MHVRLIYDLFRFIDHFYRFIYQNVCLFCVIVIYLKIMNDFKMLRLMNLILWINVCLNFWEIINKIYGRFV